MHTQLAILQNECHLLQKGNREESGTELLFGQKQERLPEKLMYASSPGRFGGFLQSERRKEVDDGEGFDEGGMVAQEMSEVKEA